MRRTIQLALLVAALSLSSAALGCSPAAPPAAPPPPAHSAAEQQARSDRVRELYLASVEARRNGDHRTEAGLLDQARQVLGDSPRLELRAASAHALAGDADVALELLARAVERGVGLDSESAEDFASLAGDSRFEEIRSAIAEERRARGTATVAATLGERDLMPEGLARDPRTGTLYLSSLYKGKVVAVDAAGVAGDFVSARQDGLWCTLGLRVDTSRDLLWVASAGQGLLADVQEDEIYRSGLFAFRLADGALFERYLFADEQGHLLNDLTLASDGTIFVTDTEEGTVWQLEAGGSRLERLTEAGAVPGANGIALSADEARLYVAWDLGIAVVDRRGAEVRDLAPPPGASLTGVDGLELYRGALIAIQTGIERVSRFELSADGWSATSAQTLLARHPLFDFPTTGDIHGDELVLVANAQVLSVDRVEHRFVPWPAERLADPVVLRVDLSG